MSAYNEYVETAVTTASAVSLAVPTTGTPGHIFVQPSTNVRMRMDGTAPTTTAGLRILADVICELDEGEAKATQFIAETVDGVLRVITK